MILSNLELEEQYDKFEQAMYGRACWLYPGSMELLDLNGIYDRVADIGFLIKFVLSRLWHGLNLIRPSGAQ